MATRLSAFAAQVHARLEAAGVSVPQYDDAEGLTKHSERTRIVWVTTGGTIEPPKQAGGRMPSNGSAERVRLCKVRVERVNVYILSDTRQTTEELLEDVIAAVYNIASVCEMPSYRWPTQVKDLSGDVLRAQACVLDFSLRLPVSDEIKPLTTVTGQTHTCEYLP